MFSTILTKKGRKSNPRLEYCKKPKETESMLMLKKDTERHNQLGLQLDTFCMDLSEYIFSED